MSAPASLKEASQYENRAGLAVRRVRRALDMSQSQLAAVLGIARERVSDLERGKRPLTLCTLRKLADAFGVEPLALLDDLTQ